jgi:hypothetical protein
MAQRMDQPRAQLCELSDRALFSRRLNAVERAAAFQASALPLVTVEGARKE